MVFIIILESKSRPRARKCGQKTMLFHIFVHVFLYEKPHFLMVYTVVTGGPAFSSFSFFNVFSRCLLDGSFLRLLEVIWCFLSLSESPQTSQYHQFHGGFIDFLKITHFFKKKQVSRKYIFLQKKH